MENRLEKEHQTVSLYSDIILTFVSIAQHQQQHDPTIVYPTKGKKKNNELDLATKRIRAKSCNPVSWWLSLSKDPLRVKSGKEAAHLDISCSDTLFLLVWEVKGLRLLGSFIGCLAEVKERERESVWDGESKADKERGEKRSIHIGCFSLLLDTLCCSVHRSKRSFHAFSWFSIKINQESMTQLIIQRQILTGLINSLIVLLFRHDQKFCIWVFLFFFCFQDECCSLWQNLSCPLSFCCSFIAWVQLQ